MVLVLALVLVGLLAFANGANDVSKSVATLVGSGVTDYRKALRWGAAWTVAGALLGGVLASSLSERFARSLGSATRHDASIPLAVLIASLIWVAFASRTGLPVSTTHAITGAVLGMGWIAEGLTPLERTDVIKGFLVPLMISPVTALGLAFLFSPLARWAGQWLDTRCVCLVPSAATVPEPAGETSMATSSLEMVVGGAAQCAGRSAWSWNFSTDQAHWMSSALVSLGRGMNDAPKIWALLFPLFLLAEMKRPELHLGGILAVAGAMGLGSWVAGRRVTEVLAERVTRIGHHEGFAANLVTALLVVGASRLGLAVSTTHVSSGSIVGIGLAQGVGTIHWPVLRNMLLAWIVTLPVAGLIAMAAYPLLRLLL